MPNLLTIGCDPEFIFANREGIQVEANKILKNGDFGMDGRSSTGELRPKPAGDSLHLVSNIRKLICEGMKFDEISELDMLCGHYKLGSAIGGHIHMSGFAMDMVKLSKLLVLTVMRLSDCIDDLDEKRLRARAGYGDAERSPYREQGGNWIEFRRPCSWLLSPKVAFLNLWLAEATCHAYIAENKNIFDNLVSSLDLYDGLIKFAEELPEVPNQDLFLKVADNTFSELPLNWNQDLKQYWR